MDTMYSVTEWKTSVGTVAKDESKLEGMNMMEMISAVIINFESSVAEVTCAQCV